VLAGRQAGRRAGGRAGRRAGGQSGQKLLSVSGYTCSAEDASSPSLPLTCPASALQVDPARRPSATQLLAMPYFADPHAWLSPEFQLAQVRRLGVLACLLTAVGLCCCCEKCFTHTVHWMVLSAAGGHRACTLHSISLQPHCHLSTLPSLLHPCRTGRVASWSSASF
jgi:hypothetical protein